MCRCISLEASACMCDLDTYATQVGFFFFLSPAISFHPFLHPLSLHSSFTASQTILFLSVAELRADKGGWRAVKGGILWVSVARLAANHLYEHAGG